MNAKQMLEKVNEIKEANEYDYEYIGIRFENKDRSINDIIDDYSKSNMDRDNERDFPEYDTDEYNDMDDLNGVCAYNTDSTIGWTPVPSYKTVEDITDITDSYLANHCYIIGSNDVEYGEDNNELIMADAIVLEKLF